MSSAVINRVMIDPNKDNFYGGVYDVVDKVSLNQFDPKVNSNKFYIAEIHSNNNDEYRMYINYGRVGTDGQHRSKSFHSLSAVRSEFERTVRGKISKGYVKVDLAVASRGSDVGKTKVNPQSLGNIVVPKKVSKSKLDPKVIEFVQNIYKEANQAVSMSITGSAKSDIKAPIGNLGVNGISKGRDILSYLSDAVSRCNQYDIDRYNIEYYKYIPRKMPSNIRVDRSWLINTQDKITREMEILDLYEDTLRMLPVMGMSDIDAKYEGLKCDIKVADRGTFNYVKNKVDSSYAPNHNFRGKVVQVYEVSQKNAPRFDDSCGNVRHLFHGTRAENMVGILSSYLKLPNTLSGVKLTGAMFGPGIYFASDSSKSLQYSIGRFNGGTNSKKVYMFVCQVALGKVKQVTKATYYTKAPRGYNSVMGVGERTLQNMIARNEAPSTAVTSLINNEFIIYNQSRQRIKYIVELEML